MQRIKIITAYTAEDLEKWVNEFLGLHNYDMIVQDIKYSVNIIYKEKIETTTIEYSCLLICDVNDRRPVPHPVKTENDPLDDLPF